MIEILEHEHLVRAIISVFLLWWSSVWSFRNIWKYKIANFENLLSISDWRLRLHKNPSRVEQHVLVKWAKYLTSFSSGNKRTIVCRIPVLKVADLACGCSLLIQNYTFTDTIRAVCSFLFLFKGKTNICLNISREVCQRCKIKSRQQSMFIYKSVFVILVSDYGLPHLHFFIPFSFHSSSEVLQLCLIPWRGMQ